MKNAYDQILNWNKNMKIDYSMEKFAQSQGCVRTHADHSEGPSVGHVIMSVSEDVNMGRVGPGLRIIQSRLFMTTGKILATSMRS